MTNAIFNVLGDFIGAAGFCAVVTFLTGSPVIGIVAGIAWFVIA